MGGRGSDSGGGGSTVGIGKKVTVRHSVYGTVKGTVSKVNGKGNFYLSGAKSASGQSISEKTVFTPKDITSKGKGTGTVKAVLPPIP